MMYGKGSGCVLIALATGMWCLKMRQDMRQRYAEYRNLQTILVELLRNMRTGRMLLWQVMEGSLFLLAPESRVKGATGEFLTYMKNGKGQPQEAWTNYVGQLQRILGLSESLTLLLTRLGKVVTKADGETIDHYLRECVAVLEEEIGQYGRCYGAKVRVKAACAGLIGTMTMLVLW
ncbi:Stage III sporulation protein AB (spore_III_AB) [Lachnospiraceae bacterium XBB1006]|nr:Stage III sporulation protein AB (spore_III_AB) [Lachnospiraceae bacterium XBB1006]